MNATDSRLSLKNPVDSTSLSETVKQFDVPSRVDKDVVTVPASPVFLVDPTSNPIIARGKMVITNESGMVYAALATLGANLSQTTGLLVGAAQYVTNMLTPILEALRTPSKFVTLGLTTAAGDTVAWPLNATKKIRIMGYGIGLAAGTTAAAACTLTVKDNATVLFTHAITGAALAASPVGVVIAQINLPANGYLCAAVNTPVNVNLSSALAVGGVTVNMWGVEE